MRKAMSILGRHLLIAHEIKRNPIKTKRKTDEKTVDAILIESGNAVNSFIVCLSVGNKLKLKKNEKKND